jgi:hypothetical protein
LPPLVHISPSRSGEPHPELPPDDRLDRRDLERLQRQPGDPSLVERPHEGRRRRVGAGPSRRKHRDLARLESAEGEGQDAGGPRIQPLHVVDRQHDGAIACEPPHDLEDGRRYPARVGGGVGIVGSEQGDLERASPW